VATLSAKGRQGLQHGNVGRVSNRSKATKFRRRVLSLIQQKYSGSEEERFGPTLAAEHLAEEDGIAIDHETWRGWMLAEGLVEPSTEAEETLPTKGTQGSLGELVQRDGSFHDWWEGRGPRGCLMDMVDDATSRVEARMGKEETIWAAVGVLRAWIRNYGVPRVLYTDWKNVYKRKATGAEQMRGQNSADAVWTHVPEAGHSDHRRQYAPGQGAGGAEPRGPIMIG